MIMVKKKASVALMKRPQAIFDTECDAELVKSNVYSEQFRIEVET